MISNALKLLQSEESLKAGSKVEQESKREDTLETVSHWKKVFLHRSRGTLFQRTGRVRKARTLEMTVLLHQMKQI